MEQKIMEVLRRMQPVLEEGLLRELKNVLHMVFAGCDVAQNTEVQCVDDSWRIDLEDYLMSKALEGKSADTVNRYRYELTRLLSYINKPVADITDGDISGYMRAYKSIRAVKNSTLKGVRAVYSSFFVWLRDRDRVRRNPIVSFSCAGWGMNGEFLEFKIKNDQSILQEMFVHTGACSGNNNVYIPLNAKSGFSGLKKGSSYSFSRQNLYSSFGMSWNRQWSAVCLPI